MGRFVLFVGVALMMGACGKNEDSQKCSKSSACPGKQACFCSSLECVDEDDLPNGECVSREEYIRRLELDPNHHEYEEYKQAQMDIQMDIARMFINQFAHEAYPRWMAANPSKACPAQMDELLKYMTKQDIKDPWGGELIMFCGQNLPQGVKGGFGVASKGPDGKMNTEDDIKSWD